VEKRRKPRQQRRLSCELWIDGKRQTGILRDVSEVGLYVQTRVKAAAGAEVELVFAPEGARPELRVMARVARLDRLTAHFATSGAGGLGLEVVKAPGEFSPLLVGAGFPAGAPAVSNASSLRPYRVKLTALSGGRTQMITVNAPGKEGARSRALTRAGKGWKVSEVCEG
jgi:hypothetical protein